MKIPTFRGLSPAQARDFDYYRFASLQSRAFQIIKPNCKHTATSLEEWFFLWDTHGIIAEFEDMQAAGKLIEAKNMLNLTIALWVEDFAKENLVLTKREIWEWCRGTPPWVWKSFKNKLNSLGLPFKWQNITPADEQEWGVD